MKALSFDTGKTSYQVNGGIVISFDTGSRKFIQNFLETMDRIEQKYAQNEKKRESVQNDGKALFALLDETEQVVRAETDRLFGEGASEGIWPEDPLALCSGLPAWLNFYLAVLDELDASIVEQQKTGSDRMDKYMAKYQKYQRK